MLVFASAFLMVACGDDTTTNNSPPPDTDASNVCTKELCASDGALKQQCETFLSNCLEVEDEDECLGGAWVICNG